MSDFTERFDGMFLNITQQAQGIEPLLENLFSFLRRKTDFFTGASEDQIEELVLKVVRKHSAITAKEEAEKKKKKDKEEKIKREKAEKKKRVKASYPFLSLLYFLWLTSRVPIGRRRSSH